MDSLEMVAFFEKYNQRLLEEVLYKNSSFQGCVLKPESDLSRAYVRTFGMIFQHTCDAFHPIVGSRLQFSNICTIWISIVAFVLIVVHGSYWNRQCNVLFEICFDWQYVVFTAKWSHLATFLKTNMMDCTTGGWYIFFHFNRRQSLGAYSAFIFIALDGEINIYLYPHSLLKFERYLPLIRYSAKYRLKNL